MNLLVAFDKFKDCLSAPEACEIASGALSEIFPEATVETAPLSDGGEGFCEILTRWAGGELREVPVHGPRFEAVRAPLGLAGAGHLHRRAREQLGIGAEGTVAVIEMARASGLQQLAPGQRDPWKTTTCGTGELIAAAAEAGAGVAVIGIGGSATNDAGTGALQALGLEVRGADGLPTMPAPPETWGEGTRLAGALREDLPLLRIACDVTNPLLGKNGATAVYGPQKGLRAEDYAALEARVRAQAKRLCAHFGKPESLMEEPGAGAAGGLGFGLRVGADARLIPGFPLVSAWLELEDKLARADCVLTGEGRFDASSLQGKGPGALIRMALARGKAVRVLAGAVTGDAHQAIAGQGGNLVAQAISDPELPLEENLRRGGEFLREGVARLFRKR